MQRYGLRTGSQVNSGTTPVGDVHPSAPPLSAPDRIIVVSDLHLGEGVDPVRGSVSGEHFFHDQEFETWLNRLTRRERRRGRRAELVLNGDAFDFLRVVRLPGTRRAVAEWRRLLAAARVRYVPVELRRAAEGRFRFRERVFGFGTDEPGGVWKLHVIAAAHQPVLRSLAAWCHAGHSLVIIRGNHDQDWAWPGVRRAFLALLRRAGAHLRPGQVRILPRAYQQANVYIEHGHGADWLTCAERDVLEGSPARLRLPFGSLITRYVINVLERRLPPHGSVPPSRRLVEALRQRPWRMVPGIVANALRAIPLIGLSGWKPWFGRLLRWWPARVSMTMSTALLVAPLAPLVGGHPMGHWSGCMAASLLGLGLPIAGFMGRQIAAQIDVEALVGQVRRYARRVAVTWVEPWCPRRYVVLGHSHRAEACEWVGERHSVVYLNPGAWLPQADGPADLVAPRFVWLARRGDAYVRHRLLPLGAVAH